MRHLKSGRKLNRSGGHRLALMRNLLMSLITKERIRTTEAKAKELRGWVDHLITLAKEGSLHARRQALSVIHDKAVVRKLFDTLGPRFKERPGGYTRAIKIGWRRGDHAPVSLVELVAGVEEGKGETPRARDASRRMRKRDKQPTSTM
jgi:large subunit ribosomal protein L17